MGLGIPHTIVSNEYEAIQAFITCFPKVIVKPIRYPGGSFSLEDSLIEFTQPTNIFTQAMLDKAVREHRHFQPTLFQECIEKEFEIRSYYMKGAIYSMAIFSQSNEKTKIDFRNYDRDKPNRNVPYKLPQEIEEKICRFMEHMHYDTGSLDFIYHAGTYTFLEVNTVGQFGWLSQHCNYYIEKEIAVLLTQYIENGRH
jgi:glutathione synthase/RimK-type ligase-like ATP-grasp enzyme